MADEHFKVKHTTKVGITVPYQYAEWLIELIIIGIDFEFEWLIIAKIMYNQCDTTKPWVCIAFQ